ncbi:MAG: iron-sulfur cluster assembly scaffold protein [Sulfurimonas sp.]|nr:MAG: iron-sulfur cluster assembly scaffold protein [Sulfurimonas sp.]
MTAHEDYTQEITSHFMNPQNYGVIEDADGIGVGVDNATQAYVIIYIKHDATTINDMRFATNSSQDTITLGSMLTEMLKGDTIVNALHHVTQLEHDLKASYAAIEAPEVDMSKPEEERVQRVSTEYQDSANMVLTAFRAAMRHSERKNEGIHEEKFSMNIAKHCPYSNTDCHFTQAEI